MAAAIVAIIAIGTIYFVFILVPTDIPHTLSGREGKCTECHQIGLSGVGEVGGKGIPDDHNDQTNDSCLTCHEVGEIQVIASPEGGLLYDKWWKVSFKTSEPTEDNPIWALQDTNSRSGSTTWRCKECHGWDYKGKDGVYGSGSHYTGFKGIFDANTKSIDELLSILKGEEISNHDFSNLLDDEYLVLLAEFISAGLIDVDKYIDNDSKKTIRGDIDQGKSLFVGTCAGCHGDDGTEIKFGNDVIGTIALNNPWEFIHKTRFGQPGTLMPSAVELGWSIQDIVDVLAYSQILPQE